MSKEFGNPSRKLRPANRFALNKNCCWLLACVVAIVFSGCKTFNSESNWFSKDEEEKVFETPNKIVAIWTNSVFNESGNAPVRGLGGRLYFYDKKHQPIEVDGKLSVFLYDDTNPEARKTQEASKVVHFTPEQVATKFTPTDFGASYSFWVPWDKVGGIRTQLAVIPVFTAKTGEMLVGEQARHLLPGSDPIEFVDEMDGSSVQQASFEGDDDERMKSSTIKLSPTLRNRLRQGYSHTVQETRTIQTEVLKK